MNNSNQPNSKREIKFRGMTIGGEFVVGQLSVITMKVGVAQPGTYISNKVGVPFAYQVRPETVGQFINLRDKNGKEIFEGDIISFQNRMHEVAVNFNGYYLQRYKLWRGKFNPAFMYGMSLITKPSKDRFGGEVDSAEVVGNIYENPELIQKQ